MTAIDASPWVPATGGMRALRAAVGDCRGCELWADATQAVVSRGPRGAGMVLVGEQPGDREDVEGEPFIGPAGRILAEALERAGLEADEVYLTNAVKHFRHEQRGKRRIHKKPGVAHVVACHPWLEAELALVSPAVVVCLGATAGRAVLGRNVTVGEERGVPMEGPDGRAVVLTAHPSSVLRLRDRSERAAALDQLVADLRTAADLRPRADDRAT